MALLVTGMLQWQTWNVSFVKPAQDWELELVVSFMDLIYSGLRRKNVVDELCWIRSYKRLLMLDPFIGP